MDKQIILSDEKKREMAKTFGYSRQTVWAALKFRTKSPVSNMLRKAALERGGILIGAGKDKVTPNPETYYPTAEHLMVQEFNSRVKLVADLSTGEVKTYVDGEVIEIYPNPKISELLAIQENVQHIANQLNERS